MSPGIPHRVSVASFAALVGLLAMSASGQGTRFEHLARPQFTTFEYLDGISADGSRVVATVRTSLDGFDRPVVWDAAGTPKILDLLPEPRIAGTYLAQFRQPISADGSLIGGYCQTASHPSGFHGSPPVSWDANGAIRELPAPFVGFGVSTNGFVSAVSPNGAYMYGWCQSPPDDDFNTSDRPFRWNAAGEATPLQTLSMGANLPFLHMTATSTDGTIAVGTDNVLIAGDGGIDYRPVRWNADGSVTALPLLGTDPDGHTQGYAELCSGDGSVIVGRLERYSSTGAFIKYANVCWLSDGSVVELLGEHHAMTPDGKLIVGNTVHGNVRFPARFDLIDGKLVATELGFTDFGVVAPQDVSDDGRVLAGGGSPRSDHPGAQVWIDNRMHSLEELLAERGVTLPEGWVSLDWIYFCSADGTVFVGEGTFGDERTAFRVTIPDIFADREGPVFDTLAPVRTFCDPGKTFATVQLKKPNVTDNAAGQVVVETKAGPRFPIGTTSVVWTATDAAGNVARKNQKVIVTNRKPTADAGRDVTITTTSERGARVALNGRGSSDPDKHALRFKWTANRVRLTRATTWRPIGVFPIGTTVANLTVSDAGGGKDTDTVRVRVKLKNSTRRPRGADANRSFAGATQEAAKAIRTETSGSATLSGLAYANAAAAYGEAVGEFVRWEEGQSEADALPGYSELRGMQAAYGQAATNALLSAYAETGDESLLSAYGYAAYGTAYAAADLSER